MNQQAPIVGQARDSMPIAPQGWPFLIPTALLWLLSAALHWTLAAWLLFFLLAFMLNFFRDPERAFPQVPGAFVAPADGKVIRAERQKDGSLRVDIFMNVFDVHVNRAPMSGRITHMAYTPGRFVNASFEEASTVNERNRIEMRTDEGMTIAFTQIAGLVARRIVSYVCVGDHVTGGQRIGMIRFGSRVDCEIPAGYELCVRLGDKTRAGETVLARPETGSDHA
ncbi:MAG: phosphatidylserine decarboxylase family protein [Zetaproteobacteria bacterium]|nr:MAG: phosphatidylserine decarboxylase family protein [Zetaproteobacteria bacterium]